jgi:histidyl-tRNA synthetase
VGENEELLRYLKDLIIDKYHKSVCEHISTLLHYVTLFGIQSTKFRIVLDPFLLPDSGSAHDGTTFKAYAELNNGNKLCVAAGGRYDLRKLVQTCSLQKFSASNKLNLRCIGVSFAMDMMSDVLYHQRSQLLSSVLAEHRNAVYIASIGVDALLSRIQIAGELWKIGMHACFSDSENISLADQQNEAIARSCIWLLIIKDKILMSSGTVKLRNLQKKSEIDLDRGDVVKFFAQFSKRSA